jgi:nucleotide-binding universal stress UspA family protein
MRDPLQTLLVATGARGAAPELITGQRLARLLQANLHVLHCVDEDEAHEKESLRRLRADAPEAVFHTGTGRPHACIRRHAREVGAGLLVLGPRRERTGMVGFLGDTADRVLRTVGSPTLLANAALDPAASRIMVALDGSPHAASALRLCGRLVRRLMRSPNAPSGLTVQLLTVSAYAEAHRLHGAPLADIGGVARRFGNPLRSAGVEVTHSTYSTATVVDGIVDSARETGAQLVVMGTHSSGPVVRALVGSVALDVARTLPAPLLLVPPRPRTA